MLFKHKIISLLLLPCMLMSACTKKPNASSSASPAPSTTTSQVVPTNPSSSNPNSNPGSYNGEYEYDYSNDVIKSSSSIAEKKLKIFEGPKFLKSSSKAKITVDGQELFVYETRVNLNRTFTYVYPTTKAPVAMFDMQGSCKVEIEVPEEVTSVKVRPSAYGIDAKIEGKKISFDVTHPDDYVIEYNGNIESAIHLFANAYDESMYLTEEEASKDPNIIYIGPGVYNTRSIALTSGQTLFVAGGAVLYGQVRTENMNNITVKGRGIFCGDIFDRRSSDERALPIEFRKGENMKIEGVSFFDPAGWAITLYKCKNVELNDVKIITARANGDGISVQSCEGVTVNGGFVRTFDDSLVVKNVDRGSTKDITFNGVRVWTDLAQSMEVGYETNGPKMENITFNNIIVYHNIHKAAMSIHNADDAEISGVTYSNITIEDGDMLGDDQFDGENDFLFDFNIAYSPEWTVTGGSRGKVSNVLIENVRVAKLAPTIIARCNGESDTSRIENVTIRNLNIAGKNITKAEDIKLVTDHAVNVKFETGTASSGAKINLPYSEPEGLASAQAQVVPGGEGEGVMIPEFARSTAVSYIGEKLEADVNASAYLGVGTNTKVTIDETKPMASNLNKLFDGSTQEAVTFEAYPNQEENEFIALDIEFDNPQTVGVIRLKLADDDNGFHRINMGLYGKKVNASTGAVGNNAVRVLGSSTYEISKLNANVIDIKITPNLFKMFQLRIYTDSVVPFDPLSLAEIEFYGSALSYRCPIIDSTPHADVYNVDKVVDGDPNGTSYYESNGIPAFFIVDLQDVHTIKKIVLNLPNSAAWDARTQKIEILGYSGQETDVSKMTFTTIVSATDYTFDPKTGNMAVISVDNVQARYIKVVITTNSIGDYGAQLSEFSVYGN